MMQESEQIIEYDGTYDGFLTCVNYVFKNKRLPALIASTEQLSQTLFTGEYVETNFLTAEKINKRLTTLLSPANHLIIKKGFLTQLEDKERALLIALEIALHFHDSLENHTAQPDIYKLINAIRQLDGEVHLYKGFVRFAEVNHVLVATIAPQQFVLPFLLPFFVERFPNENFMIYDKTFQLLGQYTNRVIQLDKLAEAPTITLAEDEQAIQAQWQTFFDTVAITARYNPKAQRSHMPKRFWQELTEMANYL